MLPSRPAHSTPWEGEAPAEPLLLPSQCSSRAVERSNVLRLSRSFALPMLTTKSSPRPRRGRGVGGEGADGIPAIERRCEKVERRNDRTQQRAAGENLTRRRGGNTSINAANCPQQPRRTIASTQQDQGRQHTSPASGVTPADSRPRLASRPTHHAPPTSVPPHLFHRGPKAFVAAADSRCRLSGAG